MKNQQSGFTLVELIMVIVVLGILAAFALPRFADFGGDARRASIEGAQGAVRSANAIVHSAALAKGYNAASGQKVNLEGQDINLVYGYMAATVVDVTNAAQISSTDFNVTLDGSSVKIPLGNCSFTYTAPTDAAKAGIVSEITPTSGEC